MLEFIKGVMESPALTVAAKPLIDLWSDAKNISRRENEIRSLVHLVLTFAVFVTGVVISIVGAPGFATWLANITSSIGIPAALEPIVIAYLGGWILAYPASFICKQTIRAWSLCMYGEADYVHTENDCKKAAQKLSKYANEPITIEEIKSLLDFCVIRIREPNKQHNTEWYIECRRKILHGELEQFYDLKDALHRETRALLAQKKRLELAETYYKDRYNLRKQRRATNAPVINNMLENSLQNSRITDHPASSSEDSIFAHTIHPDSLRPAKYDSQAEVAANSGKRHLTIYGTEELSKTSCAQPCISPTSPTVKPQTHPAQSLDPTALGEQTLGSRPYLDSPNFMPLMNSLANIPELSTTDQKIASMAVGRWKQYVASQRKGDKPKWPQKYNLNARNPNSVSINEPIVHHPDFGTSVLEDGAQPNDSDSDYDSDCMRELYADIARRKRALGKTLSTLNKATATARLMP